MTRKKTIALVAHDNMKAELAEWVENNRQKLVEFRIVCTGTTGKMVEHKLMEDWRPGDEELQLTFLKSGPLGGDQQLGARIAEGKVDVLVFFWDPMQAQPHDVDVKALLRMATLYNVPTAFNRSTADFLISSPLFGSDYQPQVKNYTNYVERTLNLG